MMMTNLSGQLLHHVKNDDQRYNLSIMCGKHSISKRRNVAGVINAFTIFILFFLMVETTDSANFTMGPEDHFFCGYKWDDPGCQSRQHCPTGRSEECEGFANGVKCFANTNCDTRYGDGDYFVPGQPPKQSPGGSNRPSYSGVSENATDHYWCGVSLDDAAEMCDTHCPSGASSECPHGKICFFNITACDARNFFPPTATPKSSLASGVSGSSIIPTEIPIGPPDPLPYPSEDPTDHWFCGIGIDDANAKCEVHCPTAKECPLGQICYFGTECDHRTFSPTPPPTKRPTPLPTSGVPTFTSTPTQTPTTSDIPSSSPSETQPTRGPMTALQASFYCGLDWDDAITNCKMKCPSGESTECPSGEECFAQTPCTEEMGYPDNNGINGTLAENGDDCVQFVVTITADQWPKETSWQVEDIGEEIIVVEGSSDVLIPGEPVKYQECVNKIGGCYIFTINDAGGDGLCCKHGKGSYTISWGGDILKEGAAFYDSETTPFGLCGETELPTNDHQSNAPSGIQNVQAGGSSYKCLPANLIDDGYDVSVDKCDFFEHCFNEYIGIGDDWFCKEDEQCISVPSCEGNKITSIKSPQAEPTMSPSQIPPLFQSESPNVKTNLQRPTSLKPKPSGLQITPTNTLNIPTTNIPSLTETSQQPTTVRPTSGPCSGLRCYQDDHCRSQFGFCGPGETYCNENPIWTKDCPPLSLIPTVFTTSDLPIDPEFPTMLPSMEVSFTKPEFAKPKGDGSILKPARTRTPSTNYPTYLRETPLPTKEMSTIETYKSDDPTSNPMTLLVPNISLTPSPSESTTVSETEFFSENEFGCTGEPCPVSSHCRSRYGSCGPGFIYCNIHSIWTDKCPPLETESTKTETPNSFQSTTTRPASSTSAINIPTLDPLAKPSLPTIDYAVPFIFHTSTEATNEGVVQPDHDETTSYKKDTVDQASQDMSVDDRDKYFQSDTFLTEWTSSNGVSSGKHSIAVMSFLSITSLQINAW